MSIKQKIKHEVAAVISLTLYFGGWLGALVLAKVVLVLEYVPLGTWVQTRPAWVVVVLRTALYTFGVFVVLLLEKAFEGRHEYDGFDASLIAVFQHADISHAWLNTICLSAALLSYNMLSVVRKRLGKGALLQMFLAPLPVGNEEKLPE